MHKKLYFGSKKIKKKREINNSVIFFKKRKKGTSKIVHNIKTKRLHTGWKSICIEIFAKKSFRFEKSLKIALFLLLIAHYSFDVKLKY